MKIKIINTKTKVSVCRCIISQRKERKKKKKNGLYNTYHEPLSEKWIVKRSPHFTRHKLYHRNQWQYLQHPIL